MTFSPRCTVRCGLAIHPLSVRSVWHITIESVPCGVSNQYGALFRMVAPRFVDGDLAYVFEWVLSHIVRVRCGTAAFVLAVNFFCALWHTVVML